MITPKQSLVKEIVIETNKQKLWKGTFLVYSKKENFKQLKKMNDFSSCNPVQMLFLHMKLG